MPWNDIDLTQRDALLDQWRAREKNAIRLAASAYNMTPKNLVRRLQEHGKYKQTYLVNGVRVVDMNPRTFDDYTTVALDKAIVTSDWEEPNADALVKDLIVRTAVRYDITDHIVNGDLVATDQPGISSHAPLAREENEITYLSTIKGVKGELASFVSIFKRQWIRRGNHDDMINRATGGNVDIGFFLDGFIDGVEYSNYAYMVVETWKGPYLICHPKGYSNVSLALGQKIYNVWATPDGRKAHVVLGHTHHSQEGDSPDGLRGIYALGCVRHPRRAQYANLNIGTHHAWSQGFGMLLDGTFENLSLKRTNWKRLLGDLCPEAVWYRTFYPSALPYAVPAETVVPHLKATS